MLLNLSVEKGLPEAKFQAIDGATEVFVNMNLKQTVDALQEYYSNAYDDCVYDEITAETERLKNIVSNIQDLWDCRKICFSCPSSNIECLNCSVYNRKNYLQSEIKEI